MATAEKGSLLKNVKIKIKDGKETEKIKEVKVPLMLNISKFSYKYKLSNIISSDSKNINFNIISRDKNDELFINDINGKGKIDTKDISNYLKYPRVIFYERTDKKDEVIENIENIENDIDNNKEKENKDIIIEDKNDSSSENSNEKTFKNISKSERKFKEEIKEKERSKSDGKEIKKGKF